MDDDLFTIVWFTDAHNQPGLPLDRFKLLARFINEVEPDAIVDGGDFDDFNSLCGHEKNESWKGKFKPSFVADLEASAAARALIHKMVDNKDIPRYVTLGNHDHERLERYENDNPETKGLLTHAYHEVLRLTNWNIIPYRSYLTIRGVDFTHVPMNGLNKALGGKRCCVNVAAQSVNDVCFGHTHSYAYWEEHKLGPYPGRSTIAINGGCFMPEGYVPDYAKGGQKRPWHGCHVVRIASHRIVEHSAVTMGELSDRYGD